MVANVWRNLELRHLAALHAVAETGTFGRAARQLGYTQSAMSQQIASLENLVGQRLVERERGQPRVALTEAGRLLLGHADAVVARLEAAHADFVAFGQGELGVLRVGTYQSVSTRILPLLMRDFTATWPRVEVRLSEVSSQDLLPLVERGELDLTFDVVPIAHGPFDTVELLRDPYVLLVAAGSPLAQSKQPPGHGRRRSRYRRRPRSGGGRARSIGGRATPGRHRRAARVVPGLAPRSLSQPGRARIRRGRHSVVPTAGYFTVTLLARLRGPESAAARR